MLANLFMHYAFDAWMGRRYPEVQWCRYADDGLIHCKTEAEAESMREALSKRLAESGLEMHPKKTKIVYCKDDNRRGDYPETGFDFLGYAFRGRRVESKKKKLFWSFTPAVSPIALKEMRHEIKKSKLYKRVELSLEEIGKRFNPVLRGWIGYYGQFHKSGLTPMLKHFNNTLVTWAMRKYRRLKDHKIKAYEFIESIAKRQPSLFGHWQDGKEMMFS